MVIRDRNHFGGAIAAVGKVPLDVEGEGGADSGQLMDLRGVGDFFLDGDGGCGLNILAEPGPGVGEPPGGEFDAKAVEAAGDS